jgi:cell division septation protein DedD
VYEIQVGAFWDGGRAIHLIVELRSQGYLVVMRGDQKEGGQWYRVIVGPYEDAEEAFQIKEKIQESTGVEPFLVRVPLKPDPSATSRK